MLPLILSLCYTVREEIVFFIGANSMTYIVGKKKGKPLPFSPSSGT